MNTMYCGPGLYCGPIVYYKPNLSIYLFDNHDTKWMILNKNSNK